MPISGAAGAALDRMESVTEEGKRVAGGGLLSLALRWVGWHSVVGCIVSQSLSS